jgi:hypothetical protein
MLKDDLPIRAHQRLPTREQHDDAGDLREQEPDVDEWVTERERHSEHCELRRHPEVREHGDREAVVVAARVTVSGAPVDEALDGTVLPAARISLRSLQTLASIPATPPR